MQLPWWTTLNNLAMDWLKAEELIKRKYPYRAYETNPQQYNIKACSALEVRNVTVYWFYLDENIWAIISDVIHKLH